MEFVTIIPSGYKYKYNYTGIIIASGLLILINSIILVIIRILYSESASENFFFVTCDDRVAGAPARLVRPWKKGAGGEW